MSSHGEDEMQLRALQERILDGWNKQSGDDFAAAFAEDGVQALVAEQTDGEWRAVLYHNTPAQLHGRPDLVESLTEELRAES